jgi:glycosyltransferase involved in cell wall biosynthesis
MKIALIGTRGIPANYGGFETCAEQVGARLVKNGHEVWVYCRAGHYSDKRDRYRGMNLVYIREPRSRFIETLFHTFKSLLHAVKQDFDALLVFNSGNALSLLVPLLFRQKVALHMDGLEWKRDKWSLPAKAFHRLTAWLATKLPIEMINDSRELQDFYQRKYNCDSHYITYGATPQTTQNPTILTDLGLEPGGFFFQLTRFEPENNPLLTLQAFQKLETKKKLVLVGGVTYATPYSRAITSLQDERIRLLGFVYDQDILRELYCNCYAYLHGNEVGGTNPTLLEAMASGCLVISRDVPFNREVLRDSGLYFQKTQESLVEKMQWAQENPEALPALKAKAREIIQEAYDWDRVTAEYERLFTKMVGKESLKS